MGDACSMQVRTENIYVHILIEESERRRALGRARGRWKDDTKINNGGVNVSMWTGFIWLGIGRGNEPVRWGKPERLLA